MPDSGSAKNADLLYNNLTRLYDLTNDRRKTLSGQASGLIGFTGVIQTVFLGLLVALATNTQAQQALLPPGSDHTLIIALLASGFVTFMITIGLALAAYFEEKWVPAPEVIHGPESKVNKLAFWSEKFEAYKKSPETIDVVAYEMELMEGVTYNKRIIKIKYKILFVAYVFLGISLFLLGAFGFYVIAALASPVQQPFHVV